MAIIFTSGLEPIQADKKSFNSVKESERRASEFLQGTNGVHNPLEVETIFTSGIFSLTLAAAGSGYMSAPVISFVNRGSHPGSGATATTTFSSNAITGTTITDVGTGYTLAPKVILTADESWLTFTDNDINFSTNIFTKVSHNMANDYRVHLTTDNVLPIGLYTTDTYGNIDANPSFYVVNATTDTFQLSLTSGGVAVDLLSARALSEQRYAEGTAVMTSAVPAGEPTNNMVVGIHLTKIGQYYKTVPTVTISAPPSGGTQATATATIKNGRVHKITITEYGKGYTDTPTVTFSSGHGTHTIRKGGGASVTATVGSGATAVPVTNATGVITSMTKTAGGSNYVAPTIIIGSGGGSSATATCTLTGNAINNISVTNGGTSYSSLTSLANRLLLIQTNLGNEINQANSDKIAINAWINGTPPSNWTNAGYNDTDLTNVYNTVHTYSLACVACKVDVDAIITSINTTTGTFKQHNERLCGLQAIGTNPFVPNLHHLLITVKRIQRLNDQLGIPYENYLLKLFGALFTGDDTIGTAIGNIMTNPPWGNSSPVDLADYGVQSVISAGATAPSAIITVINGFTTDVTAYEVLVTADNAAFTAHKTNDEAQYTLAETNADSIADGRKHNGWWNDPFYKFMYTDVLGSKVTTDLIADMDNETIT